MTVDTNTNALTREQIKAMRACDGALLRWDRADDANNEIVLSKEAERGDGFGKETLRVSIPMRQAIVANYGSSTLSSEDEQDYRIAPAISGACYLMCAHQNAEWMTLARFVRPGDELVQDWVIDNRNIIIMRAGITIHEVKVRVERPRKDGRVEVFSFMVDAHAEAATGYSGWITRDPNWQAPS